MKDKTIQVLVTEPLADAGISVLKDANLKLQDLKTEQTTLEKIFVSLVKENNEI